MQSYNESMNLDLEPRRYKLLKTGSKSRHGDVKVFVKNGKELDQPEILPIRDGHEQAERLRQRAPRSESAIAQDLKAMGFEHSYPLLGYVLDFYHPAKRICVEIDGPCHNEPERKAHDKRRDNALGAHGVTTWRYKAGWAYYDPTGLSGHIKRHLALRP